jgi:hypothetical protein
MPPLQLPLIAFAALTLGCWQITAHYRDQQLTFVVRVTQ